MSDLQLGGKMKKGKQLQYHGNMEKAAGWDTTPCCHFPHRSFHVHAYAWEALYSHRSLLLNHTRPRVFQLTMFWLFLV